jgi:serine/threonine protein kinase
MPRANDRIGPYQLIRKLGEGQFAEVWLAKNLTAIVAREVALKIPLRREVDLDAIRQEAAIWAAASDHHNVLSFIEASRYGDYVVIVSEYAPDGSLEQWLKRYGGCAPSVEAAVEMAVGILAGLEFLHTRTPPIIHKDLKPANILLQGEAPRLADFGISRELIDTIHSNVIAGTRAYMAPEAFSAVRNQQTDIWSIGVLLYQMLAGRRPFPQQDDPSLMKAILFTDPPTLPDSVPERLRQVVGKALAKEAKQRFQSAAEMRAALEKAHRGIQQQPRGIITPQRSEPPRSIPEIVDESPANERRQDPQDPHLYRPDFPVEPQPQRSKAPTTGTLPNENRAYAIKTRPRRPKARLIGLVIGLTVIALALYLVMDGSREQVAPEPQPAPTPTPLPMPTPTPLPTLTPDNLFGYQLEMIYVPGGDFQMGSPAEEEGRYEYEGPQHLVEPF